MKAKRANKIRGAFVVLTALSFLWLAGSVGAMEMGAASLAWGIIKSLLSLSALGFFGRCLAASLGV